MEICGDGNSSFLKFFGLLTGIYQKTLKFYYQKYYFSLKLKLIEVIKKNVFYENLLVTLATEFNVFTLYYISKLLMSQNSYN